MLPVPPGLHPAHEPYQQSPYFQFSLLLFQFPKPGLLDSDFSFTLSISDKTFCNLLLKSKPPFAFPAGRIIIAKSGTARKRRLLFTQRCNFLVIGGAVAFHRSSHKGHIPCHAEYKSGTNPARGCSRNSSAHRPAVSGNPLHWLIPQNA